MGSISYLTNQRGKKVKRAADYLQTLARHWDKVTCIGPIWSNRFSWYMYVAGLQESLIWCQRRLIAVLGRCNLNKGDGITVNMLPGLLSRSITFGRNPSLLFRNTVFMFFWPEKYKPNIVVYRPLKNVCSFFQGWRTVCVWNQISCSFYWLFVSNPIGLPELASQLGGKDYEILVR